MIRRYYITTSGQRTFFSSNTLASSTTQTATFDTVITGPPGAVVTMQVTTYTHSSGSAVYKADGVTKVLNDTFTSTVGAGGTVTLVQFLDAGSSTPGTAILIIITITAVTIGNIGTPNTQQNDKIV